MTHAETFLEHTAAIAAALDSTSIERLAEELVHLRNRQGRLFFIGVGGSAGNCSHAVNDFRKLCHINACAPTDNVAELTARTNDDGWEHVFTGWLSVSCPTPDDALFILSVGGGDLERNLSPNIVRVVDAAKEKGMKVFGIVGRANGHTARHGDVVIVVPVPEEAPLTPHAEAFQSVIWHCLVSHPVLQAQRTAW